MADCGVAEPRGLASSTPVAVETTLSTACSGAQAHILHCTIIANQEQVNLAMDQQADLLLSKAPSHAGLAVAGRREVWSLWEPGLPHIVITES